MADLVQLQIVQEFLFRDGKQLGDGQPFAAVTRPGLVMYKRQAAGG